MDVFSHWLWGVLITRKHVNWKVAGPMSVLPDLLAFVPSFVYSTMHGLERPVVDDTTVTSDFPAIAWDMYRYTHSAVVVTVAVLVTWWLFTRFSGSRLESQFAEQHRSKPLMMAFLLWLPWYSNILLDIPTHTRCSSSPRRCSTRFPTTGLTAPAGPTPSSSCPTCSCWPGCGST